MKFRLAFVIGDTELHDKLCGKYGSRSAGVQKLCRHCDCSTLHITNPAYLDSSTLWMPNQLCPLRNDNSEYQAAYFKSISHHPIKNTFHQMNFGSGNPHGIHLGTPGETLHMSQLGCTKRAVESYSLLLKGTALKSNMTRMAQHYGALLSRQSDRNFPRTKFGTSILSVTKKEGGDYAGILISILISIVSKVGMNQLKNERALETNFISKLVHCFELILGMEEFLKHGRITHNDLEVLPKTMINYINHINAVCQRKGMGSRLIKNHLHFHIPQYYQLWGNAENWNSSYSESNHKTEIKNPSKNTQGNMSSLIAQTAMRQTENRMLQRFTNEYNLQLPRTPTRKRGPAIGGTSYVVFRNTLSESTMKYDRKRNHSKPYLPNQVLDFCCDKVIPMLINKSRVKGFTEHNRYDESTNTNYLFRCNPSYRSDTGQLNSVWFDFVLCNIGGEEIPCQLLCFLNIEDIDLNNNHLCEYEVNNGIYAVMRRFESPPTQIENSNSTFITRGKLLDKLFLFDTNIILSEIAVVPELSIDGSTQTSYWLVIKNRRDWLLFFEKKNRQLRNVSRKSLISDGSMRRFEQSASEEANDGDSDEEDYSSSSGSSDTFEEMVSSDLMDSDTTNEDATDIDISIADDNDGTSNNRSNSESEDSAMSSDSE